MTHPLKPIQLSTLAYSVGTTSVQKLVALCENGTIWELKDDGDVKSWEQLPLIGAEIDEEKEAQAAKILVEIGVTGPVCPECSDVWMTTKYLNHGVNENQCNNCGHVWDSRSYPTDPNAGDYHT